MRIMAILVVTLVVGILLSNPAMGEMHGTPGDTVLLVVAVVDPVGEPIPGAKVDVRQAHQDAQSQKTGQSGFARFAVTRSAKCDVVVTFPGFMIVTRERLALERKGPTVIGIALALPDHPCPPASGHSAVQICM
jgi:hypothetical protein